MAALLVSGCGSRDPGLAVSSSGLFTAGDETRQEVRALADRAGALTVWTAYWDCEDDIETLREEHDRLAAVSLFAAYFEDDTLVVPEATRRMADKLRRGESTRNLTRYLSVVNDVVRSGKTTQKDTEILHTLLDDPAAAQNHAAELVALARELECGGIEIDYEKIRSDLDLWDSFLRFEALLIQEAQAAGLAVRIVLEPSTPVEQLDLPQGADYVVMCYNLYGGGTGPGPKADLAFLQSLWNKFSGVPNLSFALANGGYDWEEGSTAPTALTGEEAALLAAQAQKVTRDPDSGGVTFSYTQQGKTHTVWYADGETLAAWTDCLKQSSGGPVDVSLWRL